MPARDNYTDPELHDQVKDEVQESDKGDAPGQWSARKAQFMAQEYKKRGGTYKTDKETGQDELQKNLSKWSEEDWQTKDGSGDAKQSDGSRQRYLPKKSWEQMDDDEKEKTDAKKQEASKEGKQFVSNTENAKNARQNADEEEIEKMDTKETRQAKQKNKDNNGTNKSEKKGGRKPGSTFEKANGKNADAEDEDEEMEEDEEEEEVDDEADDDEDFEDDGGEDDEEEDESNDKEDEPGDDEVVSKSKRGQKRKQPPSSTSKPSSKKSKSNTGDGTVGSKHDKPDAPAPQGSAERLPKVGQQISWKALPGWVHGEVIEIVTEDKKVEGKRIKGSKTDPRLALRADSGKVAGHKPEACYFEDE